LRPELHSVVFWQRLAPQLSINEHFEATLPIALPNYVLQYLSRSMEKDSYFYLPPLLDKSETDAIRDAILSLIKEGLPPVFVYIYDQPWALFDQLRPIMHLFLGAKFSLLPNFWAWHIPPVKGSSGWSAHTDCSATTRFESTDGGTTFMSMSLWVPLTDATMKNGCMATKSGSVLGWSQDLYHWSRHVTSNSTTPRVSLSLEFQNPAFSPLRDPLLDIAQPPTFKERLALILSQFEKYKDMESINFNTNKKIFNKNQL
jgi:hypothetical protein